MWCLFMLVRKRRTCKWMIGKRGGEGEFLYCKFSLDIGDLPAGNDECHVMCEKRISSSNDGWDTHRVAALLPNQRISNMQLSAVQHEGLVTFMIRRSLFLLANSFFDDWLRSSDKSRSSTSVVDYAACSPVANIVRPLGIIRNLKEGSKDFLGKLHYSCFPIERGPIVGSLLQLMRIARRIFLPEAHFWFQKAVCLLRFGWSHPLRYLPHGQFWALYWVFNNEKLKRWIPNVLVQV
jgi:hypothetical protein